MIYQHSFQVRAPLEHVTGFHRSAASLPAITPPPLIVRTKNTPATLAEGDMMDFTIWLGPLPVRWLARIEATSAHGFTDRQLDGPFAEWVHRHSFATVDPQTTSVEDTISLRLRPHPVWWLVGMGFRLGLPFLFAYRAWKTRKILE